MTIKEQHQKRRTIEPWKAGAILAAAGFFLPSAMTFTGPRPYVNITNYLWFLRIEPALSFSTVRLDSLLWNSVIYAVCMRLLFAYQIKRFYEGVTTGRRVIIAAFLAVSFEVVPFSIVLVSLTWYTGGRPLFSALPLPLLLLAAGALIVVFPREAPGAIWSPHEKKPERSSVLQKGRSDDSVDLEEGHDDAK
jgi:hypothetical protein